MPHATSQQEPASPAEATGSGSQSSSPAIRAKRPVRSAWATIRAGLGAALGVLPHLMHHVGLLAGAALLTGALGNGILYGIGLLMSIPLLRRLRSKFRTVWAPVIGVAVFTGLFSLSAFVIGPALGTSGQEVPVKAPTPTLTTSDGHEVHH
jgi:hypothetical protein